MAHEKGDIEKDMDHWVARINYAAANPQTVTAVEGDAPWSSSFWECFTPIDACLIGWCCPCVLFGRIHHRLHKDPNLAGWSPINGSCVGWYFSSCFGLQCIGNMIQRNEIRQRSSPPLEGNFVYDCIRGWWCHRCDLVQQDKEAALLGHKAAFTSQAPSSKYEQMHYGEV